MKTSVFSLIFIILFPLCVRAQYSPAPLPTKEDIKKIDLKYTPDKPFLRMAYVGVPLFALTALTYEKGSYFKDMRNEFVPNFKYSYDDYIQYLPGAVMLAMKACGVESRSSWSRMVTSDAISAAIMGTAVLSLKYAVARPRPDHSKNNSFPSGHTAMAFMTATMLHKEYGTTLSPWFSVGGYGVATVVGISRQLNNRHWLSDVFAGAAIGIISTELGYYLGDLLFKDKGLERKALISPPINNEGNPSFIAMNLGYAHNYGELSALNTLPTSSQGGTQTAIEGAYFFNPYVGAGINFGVNMTTTHVNTSQIEQMPAYNNTNFNITSSPLSQINLTVGPYFSLPLARRLLGGLKLGVGYNYFNNCETKLSYLMPAKEIILTSLKNIHGWGINAGTSLTYVATRNLGIRLFAEFNSVASTQNLSADPSLYAETPRSIDRNLYTFAVGIGVSTFFW